MEGEEVFGGAFRGLRVLLTGHTGFKGSWLSIWLRELGAEVIGYSRDTGVTPRNFEICRLRERLVHVPGDVRNLEQLTRALRDHQPELVIHMAAQPLVMVGFTEPKRTFDTNLQGTVNLLQAIGETPSVRAFLGVTTDKVYEDQQWVWGYRENDPLGGYDPYSASKAMAELAVQAYRRSWKDLPNDGHPVAMATARGGNVIGGGDFAAFRLIPDSMKALMAGAPIAVRSPRAVRPWQHVLELLGGYLWLSANLLREDGSRFAEAWNFGPAEHEAIDCETMVKKAVELWGGGSYQAAPEPDAAHETFMLRLNWVKAATRLAWRPVYSWDQGVGRVVEWFKEYQRQQAAGGTIDLYGFCARQIEDYVRQANATGLKWAGAA